MSAISNENTFGKYEGHYEDGLFEGMGTYQCLDKEAKYVGFFSRGQFHGEGQLFVKGGKFQGFWEKGRMVSGRFIFSDGLEYKPVGDAKWSYCSPEDRRFYEEIKNNVSIKGPFEMKTCNQENFDLVPEDCYDTLDGYFHPKKMSIFDYRTHEEIRVVTHEERTWILKYCRQAGDNLKEYSEITKG